MNYTIIQLDNELNLYKSPDYTISNTKEEDKLVYTYNNYIVNEDKIDITSNVNPFNINKNAIKVKNQCNTDSFNKNYLNLNKNSLSLNNITLSFINNTISSITIIEPNKITTKEGYLNESRIIKDIKDPKNTSIKAEVNSKKLTSASHSGSALLSYLIDIINNLNLKLIEKTKIIKDNISVKIKSEQSLKEQIIKLSNTIAFKDDENFILENKTKDLANKIRAHKDEIEELHKFIDKFNKKRDKKTRFIFFKGKSSQVINNNNHGEEDNLELSNVNYLTINNNEKIKNNGNSNSECNEYVLNKVLYVSKPSKEVLLMQDKLCFSKEILDKFHLIIKKQKKFIEKLKKENNNYKDNKVSIVVIYNYLRIQVGKRIIIVGMLIMIKISIIANTVK